MKTYILATAHFKGDYLPDSSLSLKVCDSVDEIRSSIMSSVNIFLSRNGLVNSTHLTQLTDFYWDDPELVEEPRPVLSKSEFIYKIAKCLIPIEIALEKDEVAEKSKSLQISNSKILKELKIECSFKIYCDNQEIGLECSARSIKLYFNQAENTNSWDQVSFEITTLNS